MILSLYLLTLLFYVAFSSECHRCSASNFTGTDSNNAGYVIKIPSNFNGYLLLYAPPYSDSVKSPVTILGDSSTENTLLTAGYALAGTNYGSAGWAVQQGITAINTLANTFRSKAPYCRVRKAIVIGADMGSVVALALAENMGCHVSISAALSFCGYTAGTTRTFDRLVAFNTAYFVVNNGQFPWGTPNEITSGLSYSHTVEPVITHDIPHGEWLANFEFQRFMLDLPSDGYYTSPENTIFNTYMWSTQVMSELQSRVGGAFAQSPSLTYSLSSDESDRLRSLGMSAIEAHNLLNIMNSKHYSASASARANAAKYRDFNGQLTMPVITVHSEVDTQAIVESESYYKSVVASAGKSSSLYQTYVTGSGHCDFSDEQILAAVNAAVNWANGHAPTSASFSSSLGFNSAFVPGPWIW